MELVEAQGVTTFPDPDHQVTLGEAKLSNYRTHTALYKVPDYRSLGHLSVYDHGDPSQCSRFGYKRTGNRRCILPAALT